MFVCEWCKATFSILDNKRRHQLSECTYKPSTSRENPHSNSIFIQESSNSMPSSKRPKAINEIQCTKCKVLVPATNYSSHLRSLNHKNKCLELVSDGVQEISSAFCKRVVSYRLQASSSNIGLSTSSDISKILVETFIHKIEDKIRQLINNKLSEYHALKINFELFAEFVKPLNAASGENDSPVLEIKSFTVPYQIVDRSVNYHELFTNLVDILKKRIEQFQVMFVNLFFI